MPHYESKVQKQPATLRRRMRQKQQLQGQHEEDQSPHSTQSENDAYMHWCEKVLGIKSVVEICDFEYMDHLQLHWEEDGEDAYAPEGFDWLQQYATPKPGGNSITPEVAMPTKMVRGLAAKQDVQVGDIVISIPLYSLLSVPTTIDHDPVLSRILGPSARQKYGWTNTAEYEIALLTIAVLYHRSLGNDSPLSHYIDILVGTPTDSFPFLWSDRELRERAGGAVTSLARGIRQDLYEIYDAVMGTLVKEQPEWFVPPNGYDISGEEGPEWVYSFDNFRWAFALVISRHHYLPLKDIDYEEEEGPVKRPTTKTADPPSEVHQSAGLSEAVPPANQPTDSWVDEAKNEEHVNEDDFVTADDDATIQAADQRHSFLAPLADLINFGPPCLTGRYNAEEHMFELVATCPFRKGQEVTFYYSSDCADVIVANFGFLHPLVPPCLAEDWEKTSDEWEQKAKMREKELWEVYQKVDLLKDEMAVLESQLVSCGCEDGEKKDQPIYSMPTAGRTAAEEHHTLRNRNQHIRHDTGVRGRLNDEMMEELG
ncbi:hypothetical protein ACHAXT_002300 [Thalassiosira profunda]